VSRIVALVSTLACAIVHVLMRDMHGAMLVFTPAQGGF